MYLAASALAGLLTFAASPAWAYYPPLQATATFTTYSVSIYVWNPQRQMGYQSTRIVGPGDSISGQQHNGVMAWIMQSGSDYYVTFCTYDPYLNSFKEDTKGPYTNVTHLKVQDGVVAYIAVLSSGEHLIGFTTYDPDKGKWISGQEQWANVYYFQHFLVKEGVVAYVAAQGGGTLVQYAIRDPRASSWNVAGTWYTSPDFIGVDYFAITNATVYWDRALINWYDGYQSDKVPIGNYYGGWAPFQVTKVLAYFVAQPDSGNKPLWVWFTDMSIGGTNWSWNFDDGGTSTSRSRYHTFTSIGTFTVSQQVTGNATDTHTIPISVNVTWQNIPPTADAGPDQMVDEGETVTLDGSSSTDPDDGIASYLWSQTGGTSVTLSDSTSSMPTLEAPSGGVSGEALTFQLTVTDNGGLQAADSCTVTISPSAVYPMVAYNNGLAVDFGTSGLYHYNGTSWSQISTNNPEWLTAYNGNLAADFGAYGLYSYNGSAWSQISTADPDS